MPGFYGEAIASYVRAAVGRALLGDPAWANKIRDGRENEIVTFTPEHVATLT